MPFCYPGALCMPSIRLRVMGEEVNNWRRTEPRSCHGLHLAPWSEEIAIGCRPCTRRCGAGRSCSGLLGYYVRAIRESKGDRDRDRDVPAHSPAAPGPAAWWCPDMRGLTWGACGACWALLTPERLCPVRFLERHTEGLDIRLAGLGGAGHHVDIDALCLEGLLP